MVMVMGMATVPVPVLVSLSVLVSVDKGRDNTDKDRWEPFRYNRGHRRPRSGSLASRAQWTYRDLESVLVLVPVALGVGEEDCSEDGEGVSVGSKTFSISRNCTVYIPCIQCHWHP
jgi:hypothetical protein